MTCSETCYTRVRHGHMMIQNILFYRLQILDAISSGFLIQLNFMFRLVPAMISSLSLYRLLTVTKESMESNELQTQKRYADMH